MVGPCPEAAVFRSLRPQRHHVGHWGPQRTNVTVAGTPVSPSLFGTCMDSDFALSVLCLSGFGRLNN